MLDNTYINCNVKTNFGKKVVQIQKKNGMDKSDKLLTFYKILNC